MIPYTTMQKRLMRITFVQSIVVRAVSAERVQEAQEQITLLLRQRHRIGRRTAKMTSPCAICPTSPKRRRARRG